MSTILGRLTRLGCRQQEIAQSKLERQGDWLTAPSFLVLGAGFFGLRFLFYALGSNKLRKNPAESGLLPQVCHQDHACPFVPLPAAPFPPLSGCQSPWPCTSDSTFFFFGGFSFSPSTPLSLWLTHASPRLPPSELGIHVWDGTTNRSHRKKALEKGHSLQQLHHCGCLSFPPGKGRHYTERGRLTSNAGLRFLPPSLLLPPFFDYPAPTLSLGSSLALRMYK